MYFAQSLPQEHFLLKLLSLLFIMGILIFIPKIALDQNVNPTCENVVNSTTVSGNITSYTYSLKCDVTPTNSKTPESLYKSTTWYIRFFWGYIFVFLNWYFWLGKIVKKTRTYGKVQKKLKNDKQN